jgi:hypothetical protein
MPERNYASRKACAKLVRGFARIDLNIAKILDHYGIPQSTDEEVDEVLAKEGILRPVKSTTAATGHLSTGRPSVHREPRATLQSRDGEPR